MILLPRVMLYHNLQQPLSSSRLQHRVTLYHNQATAATPRTMLPLPVLGANGQHLPPAPYKVKEDYFIVLNVSRGVYYLVCLVKCSTLQGMTREEMNHFLEVRARAMTRCRARRRGVHARHARVVC